MTSSTWQRTATGAAPEDRLVDIIQAAELLGVTVRWVRRRVFEGNLRHYKLGGLLRFKASDLREYVEGHVVEPIDRPEEGAISSIHHLRHDA